MSSTSWAEMAPAKGPGSVASEAGSGPWGAKATAVTRFFPFGDAGLGVDERGRGPASLVLRFPGLGGPPHVLDDLLTIGGGIG
jgi:hypothetical protein